MVPPFDRLFNNEWTDSWAIMAAPCESLRSDHPAFPKQQLGSQVTCNRQRSGGRKKRGRRSQGTREPDRSILFLSLLLLSRRPDLGLIGPNTARHLREKEVECSVMSHLVFFNGTIILYKKINEKFLYVKSGISI